jgi:hypothetical protein
MIAEPQTPAREMDYATLLVQPEPQPERREPAPLLSVRRVAATLQVALATRRAARNDEHANWYTMLRGM